jgi:RimJ/RimL family protein N-acetyltransferase
MQSSVSRSVWIGGKSEQSLLHSAYWIWFAGEIMRSPENSPTDGVITLAPLELSDTVLIMHLDADPEIQRWFDWPVGPSAEDLSTRAARLASAERTVRDKWQRWSAGDELMFAIRSVETHDGLGWLDLQPRGDGRGSIGYGVLARHRGRGAATRSVRLAIRYAFDVLDWSQLEIRANAENLASRSVAEKTGFQLQGVVQNRGVMEHHQPLLGQSFDEAVYYLLRDRG